MKIPFLFNQFFQISIHPKENFPKQHFLRSRAHGADPQSQEILLLSSKIPFLFNPFSQFQFCQTHFSSAVGRTELIHIHKSPNYCKSRPKKGILGTQGRPCNSSSSGSDSCQRLCCGRGWNTKVSNSSIILLYISNRRSYYTKVIAVAPPAPSPANAFDVEGAGTRK